MLKPPCLTAAVLLAAAPAVAQVTTIESANSIPVRSADPNKIVCETIERTGSRLQKERVCLTAQQWLDRKYGHRADLEKIQQVVNQEPSF